MKYILIVVCFCWSTVKAQSLNDLSFGTDSTFDVVTWNIEWFPKNGTTTVDSVAEIIIALEADIIACQEIDDTATFKTMVQGLPGYEVVYDHNYFEGLAYIYNTNSVQLVDYYSIYVTNNFWRPFPRAPYLLKAVHEGNSYILLNNHLKCCGNGFLDTSDIDDEENRRLEANSLLETYISDNFPNEKVILLGDLNDELTDPLIHNVFQPFTDLSQHYQFADQLIANGSSNNWSFPSWPSHLDHILITDELFLQFNHPISTCSTIRIDDYLPNGFTDYDNNISDHRPVGLRLFNNTSLLTTEENSTPQTFTVYPNPASSALSIQVNKNNDDYEVYIRNGSGQIVGTWYMNQLNYQIDISNLSPGLYFVSVVSPQRNFVSQKLIIK